LVINGLFKASDLFKSWFRGNWNVSFIEIKNGAALENTNSVKSRDWEENDRLEFDV